MTIQLHISTGHNNSRQVQSSRGHEVAGYDVIADGNENHCVKQVRQGYRFYIAGNQISVGQVVVVVSGHTRAYGTDDKLSRSSAGRPNAGLDRCHDFVRQPQQNRVVEADGRFAHGLIRQRLRLLGARDDRGEVVRLEPLAARHGRDACGEEAVLVAVGRDEHAVGRGQHRSGEGGELPLLLLPRSAVVSGEVFVLAEFGVHMNRQHLAMCVDVDAGALGLLEQVLQSTESLDKLKGELGIADASESDDNSENSE